MELKTTLDQQLKANKKKWEIVQIQPYHTHTLPLLSSLLSKVFLDSLPTQQDEDDLLTNWWKITQTSHEDMYMLRKKKNPKSYACIQQPNLNHLTSNLTFLDYDYTIAWIFTCIFQRYLIMEQIHCDRSMKNVFSGTTRDFLYP